MTLDIRNDAPEDFDFIIGTWRVRHRRLKSRLTQSTEWIEFDGLSSTQKVLGGFGNVEAFSDDAGQTWETNWTMEFSRVS